ALLGIRGEATRWPLARLEGHRSQIVGLSFSRRGDVLAARSMDSTTRLWDPVQGRQLVSAPGMFLRFGPDDRQLAFLTPPQRGGSWDMVGGEYRSLQAGGGVWGLDFSRPDGRLLAVAGRGGVRLWDLARSEKVADLTGEYGGTALFLPDGLALLTTGKSGLR